MAKVIRGIQFEADSVMVQFVDEATDVRAEGMIYQTHTISIQREGELDDEIRAAEDACLTLLTTAISAWATTLPFDIQASIQDARQRVAYADDDEGDDDDD